MPRYHKDTREFLAEIKKEGWEPIERKGRGGHIRVRHTSGAEASITATPSNHRTRMNDRARLRNTVVRGKPARV